jgi:DnaJ-domain-containing protein 1
MMENPLVRIAQRGLEAMVEAVQEEMGRMSQQFVRGIVTPDTLAPLLEMLRRSLEAAGSAMGFDALHLPNIADRELGFDPYRILGLERSATDDEVKKRYNELIHILHPDKSRTPGTVLFFQWVVAACEMIKKERGWQ